MPECLPPAPPLLLLLLAEHPCASASFFLNSRRPWWRLVGCCRPSPPPGACAAARPEAAARSSLDPARSERCRAAPSPPLHRRPPWRRLPKLRPAGSTSSPPSRAPPTPSLLDLDLDLLCFPRPRLISSRGAGTSSLPLPWSSRPLASRRRSPLRARAPPPLLHVKADADRIVQRQVPSSSALWRPPPWPRLPSTNRAARPLSRSCQVPCSASTRRPHTLPTANSSSCLHASPVTSRGRALTSPSMPSRCVNAFV